MLLPSTLLTKHGLIIDHVSLTDERVIVTATATCGAVPCPICGQRAHRIHSRYQRTVADLPTQGVAVHLTVHTRRFWCDTPTCPRRIFAERFPSLVAAGAHRTLRLSALYLALGLALGGEGGARLADDLGLAVSPDTLLRATRAAPLPVHPTPRVLGVNDWSWRKGRRWGTILVDLERQRRIDILPDRSAGTLASWLATRPGIAVVARDRAGAYADGIRQGAPTAVQIADRFHLVKNAGEMLERVVQRYHTALRAAVAVDQAPAVPKLPCSPAPPVVLAAQPTPSAPARRQPSAQHRRVAQYQEVITLAQQGCGPTVIGRQVGLTRQTVARWLRAGTFPERAPLPARPMVVTPYEPYLRDRWQAGCQNARQLWRKISAQGFAGGQETVRRLVVQWHTERGRPGPPPRPSTAHAARRSAPPPPTTRPWSPRQARWFLVKPEDSLRPDQRTYLEQFIQRCPAVRVAQHLTREFLRLVRERDHAAFAPWLAAADACGLPEVVEFAKGLSGRAAFS
jgi:transposase